MCGPKRRPLLRTAPAYPRRRVARGKLKFPSRNWIAFGRIDLPRWELQLAVLSRALRAITLAAQCGKRGADKYEFVH